MSVRNPIIRDIKGCVLGFLEEIKINHYIFDSNSILLLFCQSLERIFSDNLTSTYNKFGFGKRSDAWQWLEKIPNDVKSDVSYNYSNCVENVKAGQKISNVGRLRLLIRLCLTHKCVHVPFEYLKQTRRAQSLYKEDSIVCDDILLEILLSVLRQCSNITFKLNILSCSFLDLSWMIPEIVTMELVPTSTLGITVSFAGEKAIIMKIKSNSVISDCSKVEVGDVLDVLNGVQICSNTKGRLSTILKNRKGLPITVTVIKALYSEPKQIFPPIINLWHQVCLDTAILKRRINDGKSGDAEIDSAVAGSKINTGFNVTYIGYVEVGKKGDAKQIDKAVGIISPSNTFSLSTADGLSCERLKKDSIFQLEELGVKCIDEITSEVLVKHSYMEISACGSVPSSPNYFAYIAGDKYCNVAKKFTCFIFYSNSTDNARIILRSIGQGFQRTHFAV